MESSDPGSVPSFLEEILPCNFAIYFVTFFMPNKFLRDTQSSFHSPSKLDQILCSSLLMLCYHIYNCEKPIMCSALVLIMILHYSVLVNFWRHVLGGVFYR